MDRVIDDESIGEVLANRLESSKTSVKLSLPQSLNLDRAAD
jgi:hypothetical protein